MIEFDWTVFIMGVVGSGAFGILYRIPLKKLPFALIGGGIATALYLICLNFISNLFAVNCMATIAAAVYCEIAARIMKVPVTTFMLPTLVPLAPGYHLYYATSHLVHGEVSACLVSLGNTLLIALGIAVGAIIVPLIMRLIKVPKLQSHLHKHK
ncbi:MAG: threonine/serine exporter family protein [Christensenellaceae bacterium]